MAKYLLSAIVDGSTLDFSPSSMDSEIVFDVPGVTAASVVVRYDDDNRNLRFEVAGISFSFPTAPYPTFPGWWQLKFADGSKLELGDVGSSYRAFTTPTEGSDQFHGSAINDTLQGAGGDDVLTGGNGSDRLDGGAGSDTARYLDTGTGVTVSLAIAGAQVTGGGGTDTLVSIENLGGSRFADRLTGNAAANVLDGFEGADTLTGGDGNDTYVVDDANDQTIETNAAPATGGIDEVRSRLSTWTLGQNIENGWILAEGDATLTGNTLANVLRSGTGASRLDGGGGADTASYAAADGAVTVRLAVAGAQATGGSGVDTLVSIEHLAGSAFDDLLVGNAAANLLDGGAGHDTLDGAGGNDTLRGGTGDDLFVVAQAGDVVVESAGAGLDTVHSQLSAYTLAANVENAVIQRGGAASLTGNALDNLVVAGSGANRIDGGAGGDTVSYAAAGAAVVANLATGAVTGGSGNDTLVAVEHLTGTAGNDRLTGDASANRLDGGAGADTLTGGAGNDRYTVDALGDVVVESTAASGGIDLVAFTLASYTLGAGIEGGRILSGGAATLNGNALANLLVAGGGDNVIAGGGGADTVSYVTATSGVTLDLAVTTRQATGGSGADRVVWVEHVIGSNHADVLRGTGIGNRLDGGAGNDLLDGRGGADTMTGGAGNDRYVVDSTGDVVIENGGGIDTVTTTLAATTLGAGIENARIAATGSANLTGNALDNQIVAGAGSNRIDGGAGSDTVSYAEAGAGVRVNLGLGTAQATGGSGSDTLLSIEHLVGSAHADVLTGTSAANRLDGGAGNDTLNGGAGADTLRGGAGDDVYRIDSSGDIVEDSAGIDTVVVVATRWAMLREGPGGSEIDSGVENARMLATGDASLRGNSADNLIWAGAGDNLIDGWNGIDTVSYSGAAAGVTISLGTVAAQATGGSGSDRLWDIENLIGSAHGDRLSGSEWANRLDGGAGNDTLEGGVGDDIYVVDALGDVVLEALRPGLPDAAQDVDTVLVGVSGYTLAAFVENGLLTLSGDATLTGNALDNVLGTSAGQTLLVGGDGFDTADYRGATAGVTVDLRIAGAQATGGSGSDTLVSIEGLNGSSHADLLTGTDGANRLDGGGGADTLVGGDGDDVYLVSGADDSIVETETGGIDTVIVDASRDVSWTVADHVERIELSRPALRSDAAATVDLHVVGNALDNEVVATAMGGNVTLDGGAGGDSLVFQLDRAPQRTASLSTDLYIGAVTASLQSGTATVQVVVDINATVRAELGWDAPNYDSFGDSWTRTSHFTLVGFEHLLGSTSMGVGFVYPGVDEAPTTLWLEGNDVANRLGGFGGPGGFGSGEYHGLGGDDTLVGTDGIDLLDGGTGADVMTGADGSDVFVADAGDTATDFASGSDRLRIAGAVGNADTVIDGATATVGPGGFAAAAELVVFTADAASLSAADAAAAIGTADGAFEAGALRIYVVDDGSSTAVFRFLAADADAVVTAAELSLVATLQGTAATAVGDYLFGG